MPSQDPKPAAVLVAVQLPGVDDVTHHADLMELERLVTTLGHEVVGHVTQRRQQLSTGAVLGAGKLAELSAWTGGTGVIPTGAKPAASKARARFDNATEQESVEDDLDDDLDREADAASPDFVAPKRAGLVVVDHELSPRQARNLERATDAEVLDRTGVIVEIFHRHARSREAKLQVELARLAYVSPRLRETGGADRQQGGIGGKGSGESSLELDRRKVRDRMAELRRELTTVQHDNDRRRKARTDQLRVALVGYTNAGKSSLMRALTGSEVLVADKLFATLDTTVRAMQPESRPRVLVSDTVGFIKKLPHDLVASFKSTLDEAHEASLLLFVVDASDPTHESQLAVTHEVLGEIGADVVPSLLVLNKIDRVDEVGRATLRARFPDAIQLSTRRPEDVAKLRARILQHFDETLLTEVELFVPHAKASLIGDIHEAARVVEESWDEGGAHMRVRGIPSALDRIRAKLASA
ncbi:MAG: GTPase HflX [Polyangiales bacterium]